MIIKVQSSIANTPTLNLALNFLRTEQFRRLSNEGFWVVLGQALAVVGSLVGVRLLTELLNPSEYGELALGLTVATLVNQTVLGPLSNGATRFYAPAVEQGDLGGYLHAVRQLLLSATGVIVLMLLLTVVGLLIAGRSEWLAIATTALVFALLSGYNSLLNGVQNAARQRAIVALHQGMDSWLRFLVTAGLLLWLGANSTVAMAGYSMAVTLVLVSQYVFFRKILPQNTTGADKARWWRDQMWKYSWPMATTGIISWGFFASQRWALELFTSTENVGYFSAVFQIGFTPFSLAGGILLNLMMPIFFGRAGDGANKQKVKSVSRSIIKFCMAASLIVVLATAIGATLHDMVFRLMVAEKYRVVSHYLPFTIFAGGVFQVSLFLSTIILVSTETRILLPLNTIGNFLIVAINLLFTYLSGMDGLFFAMVIGCTIHLGWNIHNVYRMSRHA